MDMTAALTQADLDRALAELVRRIAAAAEGALASSMSALAKNYESAAKQNAAALPVNLPESAREMLRQRFEGWVSGVTALAKADATIVALRAAGYELLSPAASRALANLERALDHNADRLPAGLHEAAAAFRRARETSNGGNQ